MKERTRKEYDDLIRMLILAKYEPSLFSPDELAKITAFKENLSDEEKDILIDTFLAKHMNLEDEII